MADPKGFANEATTIFTLAPLGANHERTTKEWFRRSSVDGETKLYSRFEEAAVEKPGGALADCVVYPDLHALVFSSLDRLELMNYFVMPVYDMVLAGMVAKRPLACMRTHPATQNMLPEEERQCQLVYGYAQADIDYARGLTDGCITTGLAAEEHGLVVLEDFGAVPIGFTIDLPSKKRSPRWV